MLRKTQRQALVIFVYVSVTCFIIYSLFNAWIRRQAKISQRNNRQQMFLSDWNHHHNLQDNSSPSSSVPKILLWTLMFGHDELHFYGIHSGTFNGCPLKCEITQDKLKLMASDAVVFHARDIDSDPIPAFHHPDQVWVFMTRESPLNTQISLNLYNKIFNWTMTYRHDSDIYHPYGSIVGNNANDGNLAQNPNSNSISPVYLTNNKIQTLLTKPKLIAWIASNCDTQSSRELIVQELSKYIQIDIYGACGTLECPTEDSVSCYEQLSTQYKFYLSFENSLCSDYVTEKYFHALRFDMVPIVYGRANYSTISPLQSTSHLPFINVKDFKSAEDLAAYLLHLDHHPDEYLQYFEWKTTQKVIYSRGWCELCKKLVHLKQNNYLARNSYSDIKSWWNTKPRQNQSPAGSKNSDGKPSANSVEPACLTMPKYFSEDIFSTIRTM